jgi:hypothetical protein
MDEVRRQDIKLWIQELANPSRVIVTLACMALVVAVARPFPLMMYGVLVIVLVGYGMHAYSESVDRRFRDARMRALWKGVQDRLSRFEEAIKKLRRSQVADLHEMPDTIRRVGNGLYSALRKADLIAHEIQTSEKDLRYMTPTMRSHDDAQSNELYRIADKNLAEYRQQFQAVMAGVQRTEAQAAVYMTTVDTLRMKMLGYRLVGNAPEMASQDFLIALAEARAQLQSIDTALDELDLGHYPKMVAVVSHSERTDVEKSDSVGDKPV